MSNTGSSKVVDFSGVTDSSQINPKRQPAGDYLGTIISVEDAKSKSDGVFQWKFVIRVGSGTYAYYCKLQENQLWKLRNLFIAAGKNVPKSKIKVNPNLIVGKKIGVTLEDDEYNDKMKSSIDSVFPASDLDDSAVGGDEDDDFEDGEEEEAEEEAPAAEEEDEEYEDEEEEEEEEEEEPPPPPVRRKKAAAAPTRTAKAPAKRAAAKARPAVDDDELEELDIDGV